MAKHRKRRGCICLAPLVFLCALGARERAQAQHCAADEAASRPEPVLFRVLRGERDESSAATPLRRDATTRGDAAIVRCIDETLGEVWRDLAEVNDAAAMRHLANARRLAETHADIPGMHAWLAEVELLTAVVAAGRSGSSWQRLKRQSLQRMASLDPARVLRPAEAPPTLVEEAELARQEARSAHEASFELYANAQGAVAYLDGELVGSLPRRIRASAGRHQLRILAPGHHAYGRFIDLGAGDHPSMRIALAPTRRELSRRAVNDAADPVLAQRRLGVEEQILWIETRGERAIGVLCDTTGCRETVQAEGEGAALRAEEDAQRSPRTTLEIDWQAARASLEPPVVEVRRAEQPWFRRWGVWAAVGTAIVIGAAASAAALRPERERRFEANIDFGDVGPQGP